MSSAKRLLLIILTLALASGALFALSSCANESDDEFKDKYLIIYDGNGGYLGNKTQQVRKLYCSADSKIPDYPQVYKDNQYTVPSLGLATRDGYSLVGWYMEGTDTYRADKDGVFVYLDTADGNGVYVFDENGKYVYDYAEDAAGEFVYIFVEENTAEAEAEYVFIDSTVYTELKLDTGFYIYKGNSLGSYKSEEEFIAFTTEYNKVKYGANEIKTLNGWQLAAELPEKIGALYAAALRYSHIYRAYNEANDSELDRYSVQSQYASLNNIMVVDKNGFYAYINYNYVPYDAENPLHTEAERFNVADRYIFVAKEDVNSPSALPRFSASYDHWNFEKDRVTADIVGEDGSITLYAHWEKKHTVYFHENNGNEGAVHSLTTRLEDDNVTYTDLTSGMPIKAWGVNPGYAGHTFVCWSRSADKYDPWDFKNDVYPQGTYELHLYAYYIVGEYITISSEADLAKIASNPSGKYLLAADIDLGGATYPKKNGAYPSGLTASQKFTGTFAVFNHKISNFVVTYTVNPPVSDAAAVIGANLTDATITGTEDFADYTAKRTGGGLD